jgi:hypothetical protein
MQKHVFFFQFLKIISACGNPLLLLVDILCTYLLTYKFALACVFKAKISEIPCVFSSQ